jgi:two-component system, LytTR family, response regulator LytT
MKIVIIEDEKLTADDLAETILKINPKVHITAILNSVTESISWFQRNEKPDLIFSDIQLGDGLCFEIFKAVSVTVPVIFCTAYDEYALNAFKANGIDYILKPFTKRSVGSALERYNNLKNNFLKKIEGIKKIAEALESRKSMQDASVLVYIKEKIIPVQLADIAFFYIENEIIHLVSFDQKTYFINKTLEELEKITGSDFYRANRKFLINRKAIKDVSHYLHRKLLINLTISVSKIESITVSKEKVTPFLHWLSAN